MCKLLEILVKKYNNSAFPKWHFERVLYCFSLFFLFLSLAKARSRVRMGLAREAVNSRAGINQLIALCCSCHPPVPPLWGPVPGFPCSASCGSFCTESLFIAASNRHRNRFIIIDLTPQLHKCLNELGSGLQTIAIAWQWKIGLFIFLTVQQGSDQTQNLC